VSVDLFTRLVYDANSELWNEDELPKLTGLQLQTLARLWGAPHSGTKETLTIRILAIRQVRVKVAPFTADRDGMMALANAFRKEALKHMAKECGLWRGGNKMQLTEQLINWRQRARANGQRLLEQMIADTNARPLQLTFDLRAA
jgi:hypothetical protein